VSQVALPLRVGPASEVTAVEVSLYDFGGASVSYRIPFDTDLEGLVALSDLLYDHEALLVDSRARIERLLAAVAEAVEKPALSAECEDYAVFVLEPREGIEALWNEQAGTLARVLRAEPGALSDQEIADAVGGRLSYGPGDSAFVDWFAAVLVGQDTDDEREVLEFAAVELLQLRHLDKMLDRSLDAAFSLLSRPRTLRRMFALRGDALQRIARMQAEAAILYEGVNSALKLMGDQYLARLYQQAARRFHSNEWGTGIERKLETLAEIHERQSDDATARRMEVLEWIIILLIAVEVVFYFLP
jgi:hypothetical protein